MTLDGISKLSEVVEEEEEIISVRKLGRCAQSTYVCYQYVELKIRTNGRL